MVRAGAQLVVEARRQLVEAVAPRADGPRGRVASRPSPSTISPGTSSSPAPRNASAFGVRSASRRWLPLQARVHGVDEAALEPEARRGRRRAARLASAPGRPRRLSRTWVPIVNACRCGERSRRCRPVVSRSSSTSRGRGKVGARAVSEYGFARAVLERDALAEEAGGGHLDGDRGREAGCGIRRVIDRGGGCLVDLDRRVTSFVEKKRPLRCPARPGVPSQPDDSCGRRVSGAGWSRPPETRCGSAAVPSAASSASVEVAEVVAPVHDDRQRARGGRRGRRSCLRCGGGGDRCGVA